MRLIASIGICCYLSLSLLQGEEKADFRDDRSLRSRILETDSSQHGFAFDDIRLDRPFRKTKDADEFKAQTWFKPTLIFCWTLLAIKSYQDDNEFRLRERMPRERTLSAGFDIGDARLVMDPRRKMIFFPLSKRARPYIGAIYVTNRGGVITLACNLNPPPKPDN